MSCRLSVRGCLPARRRRACALQSRRRSFRSCVRPRRFRQGRARSAAPQVEGGRDPPGARAKRLAPSAGGRTMRTQVPPGARAKRRGARGRRRQAARPRAKPRGRKGKAAPSCRAASEGVPGASDRPALRGARWRARGVRSAQPREVQIPPGARAKPRAAGGRRPRPARPRAKPRGRKGKAAPACRAASEGVPGASDRPALRGARWHARGVRSAQPRGARRNRQGRGRSLAPQGGGGAKHPSGGCRLMSVRSPKSERDSYEARRSAGPPQVAGRQVRRASGEGATVLEKRRLPMPRPGRRR